MLEVMVSNPIVSVLVSVAGSAIGSLFLYTAYKMFISYVFREKNIDFITNKMDDIVDKLQKKDKESGKLTRARLIAFHERSIKKLMEADGCN